MSFLRLEGIVYHLDDFREKKEVAYNDTEPILVIECNLFHH